MEITTYLEQAMTSELQGNVVDLCPVGALTSKPYAFAARPWELTKTESIDVMDAVGSAIRVDTRGREVMRILPRVNEDVNEEWISDKTRHVVDGLRTQRLDQPYVRENGRLRAGDLGARRSRRSPPRSKAAKPERIGAIAGDLAAVEEMFALKDLMARARRRTTSTAARTARRSIRRRAARATCSTPTIAGIEQADALLIIGANPRREAPVLNARIRKRWRAGNFPVGADRRDGRPDLSATTISAPARRRWPSSPTARHSFAETLKKAEHPLIIVGAGRAGAARRRGGRWRWRRRPRIDGRRGQGRLERLLVLHTAASRVGGLDLGFVPGEGGLDAAAMAQAGALDVLFLLGADEIDIASPAPFVVYIGTHGDSGAHRADVILPGAAYTEKSGTLRQHRRPRADGQPRRLPAGRGARGLGDPARAVGRARQASCRSTRWRSCAQRCSSEHPHLAAHRPDRGRRSGRHRASSRRSAARSTRRRSARRSTTSI